MPERYCPCLEMLRTIIDLTPAVLSWQSASWSLRHQWRFIEMPPVVLHRHFDGRHYQPHAPLDSHDRFERACSIFLEWAFREFQSSSNAWVLFPPRDALRARLYHFPYAFKIIFSAVLIDFRQFISLYFARCVTGTIFYRPSCDRIVNSLRGILHHGLARRLTSCELSTAHTDTPETRRTMPCHRLFTTKFTI